jgi:hypothetical protein
MSTLAQDICVTTSASAIAFHCSFNNSYALMTTSGKSASRTQTHPRLPARLTLYSRAPSFSRRSRMPRNLRRESGHMPASWFPHVLFGVARPPSHPVDMNPRNARVVLRAQDVTDIGQSFLHAVRAEPWLPQLSSLRERASFIVNQHPVTFLKLRQVNRSVVCAHCFIPALQTLLSNSAWTSARRRARSSGSTSIIQRCSNPQSNSKNSDPNTGLYVIPVARVATRCTGTLPSTD